MTQEHDGDRAGQRPSSGNGDDLIPLEDEGASSASPPQFPRPASSREPAVGGSVNEAGGLLELAADTCPKCGRELPDDAVVCLGCGYDIKANIVRTPRVTEEYVEAPAEGAGPRGGNGAAGGVFVRPGKLGAKALSLIGAALTLGAMIIAGINAPPGASATLVIGTMIMVLYFVLLHTATGVGAVAVSARVNEEQFGSLEVGASRVLVAYAAFELLRHMAIPVPRVGGVIAHLLGAAAYWALVWGLFARGRTIAAMIGLCHVVLWLILRMGMDLTAWVATKTDLLEQANSAAAAAAKAAAP
ncbi:MAG: zinc ribbon domain-containing protein [Phycisphaerales bacterium]|nr:zinc ribbon domain-containing protein [Phycisphaerales bacterium]